MENNKALIPNDIKAYNINFDGSNYSSDAARFVFAILTIASNYIFDSETPLLAGPFGIWIIDYSQRIGKSTTIRVQSENKSSVYWQQAITPTDTNHSGIVLISPTKIIFSQI